MGKPLLDVLRDLALDPSEQAAFESDPDGYMAQFGYDDMPVDALHEAVDLVADTLPPDVAAGIAPAGEVAGDEVTTLQRLTQAGAATVDPGAEDVAEPAPPGSADGGEDITRGFGEVDFDNGHDVDDPDGQADLPEAGTEDRPDDLDGADDRPDLGEAADDGSAGDLAFGSGSHEPADAFDSLPDLDAGYGGEAEPAHASDLTQQLVEPHAGAEGDAFGTADAVDDLGVDDHGDLGGDGVDQGADLPADEPVDDVGAF